MFSVLDFINRIEESDDKWVTIANEKDYHELWSSINGDEIPSELANLEVKDFDIVPNNVSLWVKL